jgi:toxin secretion/phage lysis holin
MTLSWGTVAAAVSGTVGSIATFAFGGWSDALALLLVAMGIDYVTGIASALRRKQLSSGAGFWGLARKGLILLIVLLAHRIDLLLDSGDMAMAGAIYFYVVNELISIAENYGELGLPFPDRLRALIAALKDREDKE